ncbi:MAG: hypothetical protein RLZZ200_1277 [Pseudomonadota bacterium]|jgi:uncharacterized protein (DUF849 family)
MSTHDKRPLLVSVAPNGPRLGGQDHEALPVTPAEIGYVAGACRLAGAGMIHLHVRDEQGAHSLSPQIYRAAQREIRHLAGSGFVIQVTTEAAGSFDLEAQMAAVRSLETGAASFPLAEFFPEETVYDSVAEFFAWMVGRGVACQFDLDSPAQAVHLRSLVERGHLSMRQAHGMFVLGRPGRGGDANPALLDDFLAEWPANWPWSACAYGRNELDILQHVIARGGHVRTGFEYSMVDPDGQVLESNAKRIEQIVACAASVGRPLVAPEDVLSLFPQTA